MPYKTIISAEDLKNNIDNNDFIVFDCRCDISDSSYGRSAYNDGHIQNSIFIDVDHDLASEKTVDSGRHPLPDPEILSEKLSQWGMNSSKQVVVYDDAGGAFASRMWWIFKWLGHTNVAVLDGALGAWIHVSTHATANSSSGMRPHAAARGPGCAPRRYGGRNGSRFLGFGA